MISDEIEARDYVATLCDGKGMERLERLIAALRQENQRQNLVARATLDVAWQRHIADSAQILRFVPRGTPLCLDLGSGAGFPGLVLAIMRATTQVTLVESRARRIDWLKRMVADLRLENCRVEGRRLEAMDARPVDVITARAFAPFPDLLRLSARFSTADTLFVLPKGRSAAQDLLDTPRRIREMFHVEQSMTDPDAGILVGRLGKEAKARL